MTTPFVRLVDEHTRRSWTLGPGAIIGRMVAATCRLTDSRVSEAHALVSLRGSALRLLALRGGVLVDGEAEDEVELAEGQVLALGGVRLRVVELRLPEEVLALRIGDGDPQELCAGVYTLLPPPSPELVPREDEAALARVWSTAEGWCLQLPDGRREPLLSGRRWSVQGVALEAVSLALGEAGQVATAGRLGAGLTLVARHTSVHILRARREPVILDGQPGRLLSELVLMGRPVAWSVLAREIWPDIDPRQDRDQLRRSWDRVLARLRRALREHAIRESLLRADGNGNIELVLHAADRLRDEA